MSTQQSSDSDNNELNGYMDDYYGITSFQKSFLDNSSVEQKPDNSFGICSTQSGSFYETAQDSFELNKEENKVKLFNNESSFASTPEDKRSYLNKDMNKSGDCFGWNNTNEPQISWSQPISNSSDKLDPFENGNFTQPNNRSWKQF